MKKLLCLTLCLMMVSPVFAAAEKMYPEHEVDALLQDAIDKGEKLKEMTEAYKGCVRKNSELDEKCFKLDEQNEILKDDIKRLQSENKAISRTASWISMGFGVWGIATFATTGGLYPLVTGCLFIRGAMK